MGKVDNFGEFTSIFWLNVYWKITCYELMTHEERNAHYNYLISPFPLLSRLSPSETPAIQLVLTA